MADEKVADTKAEAAAEKAYANAAGDVGAKKAPQTTTANAPAKIDAAVAAVKAAPQTAAKAAVKAPAKAKRTAKATARKTRPVAKTAATKATAKTARAKTARVTAAPKPAVKAASVTAFASIPPSITELKDKIMATAKTTDFTQTVKEMTADAQTKAMAAYEKMQTYAGDVTEFTKGNVEAMVESSKILGAGMQTIARGEVEAAKGAFETVTADLKAMAAIKSPADLFKLQGEIARRNFDAIVAHSSKNAEAGMKLASDAFAPISNRLSLAAEKISKVA